MELEEPEFPYYSGTPTVRDGTSMPEQTTKVSPGQEDGPNLVGDDGVDKEVNNVVNRTQSVDSSASECMEMRVIRSRYVIGKPVLAAGMISLSNGRFSR